MSEGDPRVRLVDDDAGQPRTTKCLLASLVARLGALFAVSGADAIGSQIAGFAMVGREVSRTADGARLRSAIAAGRAATNGEELWSALRIQEWLSRLPPSPVVDDVRNDLALLLADDLHDALTERTSPPGTASATPLPEPAAVTFLDTVIGIWAFGRELAAAVEALAATPVDPRGTVVEERHDGPHVDEGPLLR